MTAQVPEKLIINGKMRKMQSYPSLIDDPNIITIISREEFKKELREERDKARREGRPIYSPIGSTACWRRYIGTWEIKDGKFYLKDLEGHVRMAKKEPVHATWVTGVLKVAEGKMLHYSHSECRMICEKEIHIKVENGIVKDQTIIDNTSRKKELFDERNE